MRMFKGSRPATTPGSRVTREVVLRLGHLGGRLGLVVIGVGLLVIGLGWNGANNSTAVVVQMPYLISGGLLGLALVVIGAALLVVHAQRDDRARLEERLALLVEALQRQVALDRLPTQAAQPETLVVAGATAYHRLDCRLIDPAGHGERLEVRAAESGGLRACRVCKPLQTPSGHLT